MESLVGMKDRLLSSVAQLFELVRSQACHI